MNCLFSDLHDVIHLMCVTENCEYIVVADRSSNVVVWKEFQVGLFFLVK